MCNAEDMKYNCGITMECASNLSYKHSWVYKVCVIVLATSLPLPDGPYCRPSNVVLFSLMIRFLSIAWVITNKSSSSKRTYWRVLIINRIYNNKINHTNRDVKTDDTVWSCTTSGSGRVWVCWLSYYIGIVLT